MFTDCEEDHNMKFLYAVMQKEGMPHQSYKLQVVPYEVRTSRRCYWAYCLALVDYRQRYQCSQTWRSNAYRKAIKELEASGWICLEVVMAE